MSNVVVTATREVWEALLAALPHCLCGELAEVEHRGTFACLTCAASTPRARGRALAHVNAAMAIAEALSPHLVAGKWRNDDGST